MKRRAGLQFSPRSRSRRLMFTTRFEAWVRRRAEALMSAVGRVPLTPNQVTVVGMVLTFVAATLAAFGQLRWAGVVLILAGTCDILDGALARSTHKSYTYGAFLDSTLDRYSEGAIYLGLAAYFVSMGGPLERWLVLATLAALAGSFLVSYVRARAQSLGFTCDSGVFARPERVVVTVIGLIFSGVLGGYVLYAVVFLLAVLTNLTALQRIREVWLQGRAQRLAIERETKARRAAPPQTPSPTHSTRSPVSHRPWISCGRSSRADAWLTPTCSSKSPDWARPPLRDCWRPRCCLRRGLDGTPTTGRTTASSRSRSTRSACCPRSRPSSTSCRCRPSST